MFCGSYTLLHEQIVHIIYFLKMILVELHFVKVLPYLYYVFFAVLSDHSLQ